MTHRDPDFAGDKCGLLSVRVGGLHRSCTCHVATVKDLKVILDNR